MKTGNISGGEALDSLSEEERTQFGIRILDEVYAIDEELRNAHGGLEGSGRYHLLQDPMTYIARGEYSLRQNSRIYFIDGIDGLVCLVARAAASLIHDDMRSIAGDTRKIDRRTGAKVIKHQPASHVVKFIRDDENPAHIVDFDVVSKFNDPILDGFVSIRAAELTDATARSKFLDLLIATLETLGRTWSDRLSAIFAECTEHPELIGLKDGRLHFNVNAIAAAIEDKPQNVSNALRHLDGLAEELGDPEFAKLIQNAGS
jgi:hypothetical protein